MGIISRGALPIKPNTIRCYFDRVAFWLPKPADHATFKKLKAGCGKGGIRVDDKHARFGNFCQRIELRQPSEAALRILAHRRDALVNAVEFAADFIFDNPLVRDAALDFLHRSIVRKWHGRNQPISVNHGTTRYDAPRWARNKLVAYPEAHCRITGEVSAIIHLEWRSLAAHAVRQAGINAASDLLEFDHVKFWEDRLVFYDIDPERLGRLLRNAATNGKSRTSPTKELYPGGWVVNLDRRAGHAMINGAGTIQEVIDRYGSQLRVHRALTLLPIDDLLRAMKEDASPYCNNATEPPTRERPWKEEGHGTLPHKTEHASRATIAAVGSSRSRGEEARRSARKHRGGERQLRGPKPTQIEARKVSGVTSIVARPNPREQN